MHGAILLLLLASSAGATEPVAGPSFFHADVEPLSGPSAPELDHLDAEPL